MAQTSVTSPRWGVPRQRKHVVLFLSLPQRPSPYIARVDDTAGINFRTGRAQSCGEDNPILCSPQVRTKSNGSHSTTGESYPVRANKEEIGLIACNDRTASTFLPKKYGELGAASKSADWPCAMSFSQPEVLRLLRDELAFLYSGGYRAGTTAS